MRRNLLLTLLLTAASLFGADPWIGIWKMDLSKSKFPGPPPRDVVLTYEARDKGFHFTSAGKLQDGTPYSYSFTGAADGKEYKVENHPSYETAMAKAANGVLEVEYRRAGSALVSHKSEFKENGTVMITTTVWSNPNGEPFTTVARFDKQ